ncbi:MAG: ABC transporter ATP-binding protein [Myxococcales bacterium]|nr:ABC transporter ATP-binding protein [Myxococcales bacterium]
MIVVENVTKYYGAHAAVRDLTFRIEEGECVGFLGLNGAGKTTTLKLLSCLLLPTSGRASIRGLDVEAAPHEIRKFIGFLPDTPPLYDEMLVSDYLRFAGKLRKMTSSAVSKRLPEVVREAGLEDVAGEPIATLSHGYRQRVGIAQAIIHQPALLILDEPINGLDPVQIVEMRELIRGLRGKHTILLSTHILSEIEQTCDRILMLNQGRVAAQGTEHELLEKMSRGSTFVVEVRAGDGQPGPEGLTSALKAIDGVTGVVLEPHASDAIVRAQVQAERDVRGAAAKALVGGGFELVELSRRATGLEKIFVELSRGQGPVAGAPTPTASTATESSEGAS